MSIPGIISLLQDCNGDDPPFPPTEVYNENWLVRLVLDWHARNLKVASPLAFSEGARWFSEARLKSAFSARRRRDSLAEGVTSADGVVGHFDIHRGKSGCVLRTDASQLLVVEAKIFSPLSSGTQNVPYYDQAARTVACIAELLRAASRVPQAMSKIAFIVIAPEVQIHQNVFHPLTKDSINRKVRLRVDGYAGERDEWYQNCFLPLLDKIELSLMSWESTIELMRGGDLHAYEELKEFYARCLQFSAPAAVARN